MRLNLREIIHVPGASLPFQFQLDLSGEDFFGEHPIPRPVTVTGHVKNVADVLVLEGEARSVLDETCDRCMTRFSREKVVPLPVPDWRKRWRTRGGRHCPPGQRRGGRGPAGLHRLHPKHGHETLVLRRLQGTLPRLWRQPQCGALPV